MIGKRKSIHVELRLYKITLDMDRETVANAIEEAHSEGTAPIYYNDEQALRSIIRFAYIYISCIDEYLRIEELPSGTGYADVVYLPKKNSDKPIMAFIAMVCYSLPVVFIIR